MKKRVTTLTDDQLYSGRATDLKKQTIVLLPLTAPHVAMYAVESAPSVTPKIAHKAQSTKPRPKSNGPVKVTARLLIVRFALNHNRSICSKPMLDGGCRSLSWTRARPRASKPARLSIRAFHLLNQGSLEMSVDDGAEVTACSSVVPFSSASIGPMFPFPEDMALIEDFTCHEARSTGTINTKAAKLSSREK